MFLRESFPFDYPPSLAGWSQLNILAATKDRQTWWINAGHQGGIRGLVHFVFDRRVASRPVTYWGSFLHSQVLVACTAGLNNELCRAADIWTRDGLTIAPIIEPQECTVLLKGGEPAGVVEEGNRLNSLPLRVPVPHFRPTPGFLPEVLPPPLVPPDEENPREEIELPQTTCRGHHLPLPGFLPLVGRRPGVGEPLAHYRHRDGWFTMTERAIQVCSPKWAPDASAFDIREGIYVCFADGTFRLVKRREYYAAQEWPEPQYRQGDLMFWRHAADCRLPDDGEPLGALPVGEAVGFDRHTVVAVADGSAVVTHPEHEPLAIEPAADKYQTALYARLAPGTSRPFQREEGLD